MKIEGNLDFQINVASGSNSPKTTYNIAPDAKLNAIDKNIGDILGFLLTFL